MAFSVPRSASYAMRMLVQLALAGTDEHLSLSVVSAATGISRKFLEQLATPLRQAGIIKSRSGKDGGYRLARSPSSITVKQVIEALYGPFAPVKCVPNPEVCFRANQCECRWVYLKMTDAVSAVLGEVTIDQLVERRKKASPIQQTIDALKPGTGKYC
ncbi:MAG: Rrf2 family transcriptional regulator [Deltaproteobacteria bacterium]|nr:MAG: Rrf2 family transcriptional regulator [Deltaproteobacteria bacterium]